MKKEKLINTALILAVVTVIYNIAWFTFSEGREAFEKAGSKALN